MTILLLIIWIFFGGAALVPIWGILFIIALLADVVLSNS